MQPDDRGRRAGCAAGEGRGSHPRSQSATPPGTTRNSGWTRHGDAACPSSHSGARASSFLTAEQIHDACLPVIPVGALVATLPGGVAPFAVLGLGLGTWWPHEIDHTVAATEALAIGWGTAAGTMRAIHARRSAEAAASSVAAANGATHAG